MRIARNIAGPYRAHLPEDAREAATGEALAVLGHSALAPLFALPCLCEAELAGHIGLEGEGGGALFGRIDRLVFDGDELLLLDYKTAIAIPSCADAVPQAHLLQMAVYRHLLARMMPAAKIKAALLYSAGPALIPLPDHNLDIVMADLRQCITCHT
jgi:ATP-dependent helicase/nuclease subunit A